MQWWSSTPLNAFPPDTSTKHLLNNVQPVIPSKMNIKCPLPRGPVPLLKGLPGTDDVGPNIFDGRAVLRMLQTGCHILDRVSHYDNERSDAIGVHTVGFNFRRTFECFAIMAHAFCGDLFLGMFEGRVQKYEDIRKTATAAAINNEIRDLLAHATRLTFKPAKEFDSALRMWSVEEVSFHLYSHMMGKYHLGELMRFILNLLEGRGNGRMSIETMKRMVTYKYSWLFHDGSKDASSFVRQAVHMIKKMQTALSASVLSCRTSRVKLIYPSVYRGGYKLYSACAATQKHDKAHTNSG